MVNYDGGAQLLNALSGKTTLFGSVYIGLSSTTPNIDGTGFTEPFSAGSGYARVLIGSTTGGMILYTVCSVGKQPACMLFAEHIDSLAASGAIMGAVWTDAKMPVVDELGEEFLEYVQTGMTVTIKEDGVVEVG